jgi:hypothetical protein
MRRTSRTARLNSCTTKLSSLSSVRTVSCQIDRAARAIDSPLNVNGRARVADAGRCIVAAMLATLRRAASSVTLGVSARGRGPVQTSHASSSKRFEVSQQPQSQNIVVIVTQRAFRAAVSRRVRWPD